MRFSSDKTLDCALRAAIREGAVVTPTGGGHLKLVIGSQPPVFIPSTPSKWNRSADNSLANVRRAIRKHKEQP